MKTEPPAFERLRARSDRPAAHPSAASRPAGDVAQSADEIRLIHRATVMLFAVLGIGLVYWQLVRSSEFVEQGRRQTLRRQILPAPRGTIYDREHRVLAETRIRTAAALHLGALRDEIQHQRETNAASAATTAQIRAAVVQRHLTRVNAITGRRVALDTAALERHFARERTAPFVLLDDLNAEEAARLAATLTIADPVRLERSFQRVYPRGQAAAHVLGRLRRERTTPAAEPGMRTLDTIDEVGETGLEKYLDARLRGAPGHRLVQINAAGFLVDPVLETHPASAGQDATLSLDLELQLATERAMAAASGAPRGAAVVLEVATGEILAMTSKPDFDLNTVSPRISATTQRTIDDEGGWLNRATQALYPPGSVFKIFTTLAGLRHGTLRPDTEFECPGYHEINGQRFRCHAVTGHGTVNLRRGLAQSCNVFAYQVGLAAGADAIAAEARRFHLGEPTCIDLPFETRDMLVADPAWKEAHGRGAWTIGDTINLSIGQGFLRISPLQAACAMASLARRETLTVPTLLRQPGRRPSGDRPTEPLGLSDRDYAALVAGLEAVVQIGIGQNAQVPGVRLAGKSGTAQISHENGAINVAWFVAFAPVEHPEIAIAVALEGPAPGEEFAGAAHAAPVVREIAGAYFDQRRARAVGQK